MSRSQASSSVGFRRKDVLIRIYNRLEKLLRQVNDGIKDAGRCRVSSTLTPGMLFLSCC